MKTFLFATLLGLASASPIVIKRDIGVVANEYVDGGCRNIIFFYARGTSELGNMGSIAGPPTANGLQAAFGDDNVAVQGIDYPALISTNLLPGGADPNGIRRMHDLLIDASSKCPDSILVAGGYRYGSSWPL
jgi:cutinase